MANRRPTPRPGNNPPPRKGPNTGGPPRRPPTRRPFVQGSPAGARPEVRPGPRQQPQPQPQGGDDSPDRLQKVLAHAGVGSRRACEELITQGRVTIDGQIARELGVKVDARRQQVAVDGQKIHAERNVYYAVHKPKGYVSTNSDPAGKPRVVDLLPEIPQRVYSVGRLDEQSTGLMLLTNDGELANKLAHPKFGVEKVYRVVVAGEPGREILDQLTKGIWLAEGKVRAKRVKIVGHKGQASIMEMVLAEGKNREIRRMLAKLGHKVMSLTRIAVGPIGLKGIGVGECRPLSNREVEVLQQVAAGMNVPTPRYPDRRDRVPRQVGNQRPARPAADSGSSQEPQRPAQTGRPGQGQNQRPPYGRPQGGENRPQQRPAGQGRPPQGQGERPNYARPQRGEDGPQQRPAGQGQRPSYGRPRDGEDRPQQRPAGQGQVPRPQYGRPQGGEDGPQQRPVGSRPAGQYRPGQGQGQRPAYGQAQGGARRSGPPQKPPLGRARKSAPPQDDVPTRKIIGMEGAPPPRPDDEPTGPRIAQHTAPKSRRPAPRRAPRAALGLKRPPRKDGPADE